MMHEREGLVPGFIPAELVEEGLAFYFAMAHMRPDGMAWKAEPAIKVVAALADNAHAILGGDVLKLCEGQLAYTGDYWDLLDEDVVLWEEYVEHTRQRSIAYIENTQRSKGEALLYTIFFISELDYKDQMRNFGSIKYR